MTFEERVSRRAAVIERHLKRVAELLPEDATALQPMSEASDGIILHLWQAVQSCIDLAVSECAARGLGPAADYASAFSLLADAGVISIDLAARMARACGFRNLVAHAYETLDLEVVFRAAQSGPFDLREFVTALAAHR